MCVSCDNKLPGSRRPSPYHGATVRQPESVCVTPELRGWENIYIRNVQRTLHLSTMHDAPVKRVRITMQDLAIPAALLGNI